MTIHKQAGEKAPTSILVNIPRLISAYYIGQPDISNPREKVEFGTSGHRGSSLKNNFNETHILAVTQAICDYRKKNKITGPLFLGMDTHALSEPSHISAIEVLTANEVETHIHKGFGYTPTPVISHAILSFNKTHKKTPADGIVITPSHNPPDNGGFKYNPPHGGPADTAATRWIQDRANELIADKNKRVNRLPYEKALRSKYIEEYDYILPYVTDLDNILDMEAIRSSGLKIGVDPMGGACIDFWEMIGDYYGLHMDIVDYTVDPTFSFMSLDRDGVIRMDCSSAFAMSRLIRLRDRFDIAFGNDPDVDRHGIVTKNAGLMNPNHYLSAAIYYLFQNRPGWKPSAAVGKTLVSSAMIDRVAGLLGKSLSEVPVGFKWFVDGLLTGDYGFGGEESAGATFLRKDGTVWTTDKDGIIMNLLAVEMTAATGKDPGDIYGELTEKFGDPVYERLQAPATYEQKAVLKALSPEQVKADKLAGDEIRDKLTAAPGNKAPIGGLKVVTDNGWFAARPSGTEDIYKIYTESFVGMDHLKQIQDEAQAMVSDVLASA